MARETYLPIIRRVPTLAGQVVILPRRQILYLVAGAAVLPAGSRSANAQTYPTRPVHIVAAVPPGNGPDILARLVGQRLSERLGQQFIVDDRPGADDNIGIEFVVRAPTDGYTLLLIPTSAVTNASLYPNLSFNFIRDIAAVACIGRTPFVFGGSSITADHNGPRVHRLRQGQSRQDQYGILRHRQWQSRVSVHCLPSWRASSLCTFLIAAVTYRTCLQDACRFVSAL